jgi:hypothetical protein
MADRECPGQIETIHRYLDQDLTRSERDSFLAHLSGCATCQAELARLQTLFSELDSLEEIAPPAGLVSQVMAQLPAPSRRQVGAGQLILAGQMLAGLALVVFAFPWLSPFLERYLSFSLGTAIRSLAGALTEWGVDLGHGLVSWLPAQWPSLAGTWGLDVSPGTALLIIACLGLIWLAGNFLLLNQPGQFLKNRGAS